MILYQWHIQYVPVAVFANAHKTLHQLHHQWRAVKNAEQTYAACFTPWVIWNKLMWGDDVLWQLKDIVELCFHGNTWLTHENSLICVVFLQLWMKLSCHDLNWVISCPEICWFVTLSLCHILKLITICQFRCDFTYLIPCCTYNMLNMPLLPTSLLLYVRRTNILLLRRGVMYIRSDTHTHWHLLRSQGKLALGNSAVSVIETLGVW